MKIKRLKIDGTPENPTITLELELVPKIIPMIPKTAIQDALSEVDPK